MAERKIIKITREVARKIKTGGPNPTRTPPIPRVTAITVMVTKLGTVWLLRHVLGRTGCPPSRETGTSPARRVM